MACRAVWVGRVCLELHADGGLGRIGRRGFERFDVRRRRRRRLAEDGFGQPHTAMHRAMPHAVGSERQHRGVGEQPAAPVFRPEGDALEISAFYRRETVVEGEAGIEHRPVRVQKLAEGEVAREDLREVALGFEHHAFLQPFVVGGVKLNVRREGSDLVQLQPLMREGVEESCSFGVGQHAADLRAQDFGLAELPLARGGEERFVRHRAPEEITQPRRELPVVRQLPVLAGGALVQVVEVLRSQGRHERGQVGRAEFLASLHLAGDELFERGEFNLSGWTTPRAVEEALQAGAHGGGVRTLGQQAVALLPVGLKDDGAFPLARVHHEQRRNGRAGFVPDFVAAGMHVVSLAAVGERRLLREREGARLEQAGCLVEQAIAAGGQVRLDFQCGGRVLARENVHAVNAALQGVVPNH